MEKKGIGMKGVSYIIKNTIGMFIILLLIVVSIYYWNNVLTKEAKTITEGGEEDIIEKKHTKTETPVQSRFIIEGLSEEIVKKIQGLSWKKEAPVGLGDLRYVQVTYWGFDGKEHIGELIVNREVAEEAVEIFRELYTAKFPIEKIRLIDEYNADDELSMEDNNSSALNFRPIMGTNKLSKHSYGLAIDINPVQNPYITKDKVLPPNSLEYVDRSNVRKGMIVEGDVCYNAFTSRGWTWGGSWKTMKDYQHFQKELHN